MGNYASRLGSSGTTTNQPVSSVKCHYEILCIDPSAGPDEIKKAYRQQALLHHPDKNPHRQEEATAYFALIQKAYEVLSDPQERSWYDRNRDAILGRAKQKKRQTNGVAAPTLDDLMPFFSPSAYTGFGDDPKGFFAVYRKLFELIEGFENEGQEDEDDFDFDEFDPEFHTSFGSKSTPIEPTIFRFYEKWLNFTSSRPFYEVESYDTDYADNRRMRRAMEKENEKKRETLRREFSETVRSLAAFIRKRDPRWKAYQAERQAEKEKAESQRKQAVKATRKADIEGFVEPDWARKDLDDLQSAAKEFFADDYEDLSEDESEAELMEDEFDEIYCDPCKKLFKTKTQWLNHEKSKKHKDTLRKMGIRVDRKSQPEEDLEELDDPEASTDDKVSETDSEEIKLESEIDLEESEEEEIDEDVSLEVLLERIRLEESGRKQKDRDVPPPETAKKPKKTKKQPTSTDEEHRCTVCKQVFQSRNQLFKHVNAEGHALAPKQSKATKKKK